MRYKVIFEVEADGATDALRVVYEAGYDYYEFGRIYSVKRRIRNIKVLENTNEYKTQEERAEELWRNLQNSYATLIEWEKNKPEKVEKENIELNELFGKKVVSVEWNDSYGYIVELEDGSVWLSWDMEEFLQLIGGE